MKPLPPTFIHGASTFWVPMQPQPVTKDLGWFTETVLDDNPHAVGDILFEREEWFIDHHGMHFRDGENTLIPEHAPDNWYRLYSEWRNPWQPASTMPEWAARQRYTVASFEEKQYQVIEDYQYMNMKAFDNLKEHDEQFDHNDWGWYFTLTELKGERQ